MPGPRVKPTIETAGDIAYGRTRARVLRTELLRRFDEYNAAIENEMRRAREAVEARARSAEANVRLIDAFHDEMDAKVWIRDHGGSVSAALKETHPDHGGTSHDLQMTMWARDVLRGKKKTQRPR